MATYEKKALLTAKNEAGDKYLIYPMVKLDCVEGADDLVHNGDIISDEEIDTLMEALK